MAVERTFSIVMHVALERMRADRRRLELLIRATAKLDTSLDPQQTLRRIAATAVPELAELCVVDLVDDDEVITTTVAASIDPALATQVEEIRRGQRIEAHDGQPISVVLSSRRTQVLEDLSRAPAVLASRAAARSGSRVRDPQPGRYGGRPAPSPDRPVNGSHCSRLHPTIRAVSRPASTRNRVGTVSTSTA